MNFITRIKNNRFWVAVMKLSFGQIAGQAINLICVPILSRLYFTNDYGQLNILVSTATIITGIVCVGINSSMMLAENEQEAQKAFHVSQNLQISLAAILVLGMYIISSVYPVINTDIPMYLACLLIFLYISLNARNSLLSIYLNRQGKNNILLLSPIVNACANLLIALPLGFLGLKYYGLIISAICALAISNFIMTLSSKIGFKFTSINDCIYVLRKYVDLVKYQYPSNLVTSLSTQTPNQVLSKVFDNNSLGSYSMCDKIFHIPFTMIATPIQTIYFRTASKMSDQLEKLSDFTFSMVSKILYIAFIPILIVTFWGSEIFSFVLGADWGQAGDLASYLILSYVFSFVNNCITYCRVAIGKAKVNLFTSIINLILIVVAVAIGAFVYKSLFATIILYSLANTLFGASNIYVTLRCLKKNYNKYALLALIYILVSLLILSLAR